jgi:hypothetical protein
MPQLKGAANLGSRSGQKGLLAHAFDQTVLRFCDVPDRRDKSMEPGITDLIGCFHGASFAALKDAHHSQHAETPVIAGETCGNPWGKLRLLSWNEQRKGHFQGLINRSSTWGF